MRRRTTPLWWTLGAALIIAAALTGAVVARRVGGGLVLSTVTMGASPDSITVDVRTGRAFVINSADNSISVLDTHTGAVLLRAVPGVANNTVPPVLDERTGHLFAADFSESRGQGNTVYMLDARSGAVLHVMHLPWTPPGAMALDSARHRLFLGTGTVLDTRTSATLTTRTGTDPGGPNVVDQRSGWAFFTAQSSDPLAWTGVWATGAQGRTVWRRPMQDPLDVAVDGYTRRVFVTGPTSTAMLDERNGRVLRVDPVGSDYGGTTIMDEGAGRLFVIDVGQARVSTIDARSGIVLHTLKVAADASPHQFAVDDRAGRAYLVAGVDGTVSVIDTRTGALVHGIRLGQNASAVAVDERTGRVFVTGQSPMVGMQGGPVSTGPGTVTVLDARTGAILGKAAVGVSPVDVAVDERSGHAFVVASGGWLRASDPWRWLPAWLRCHLPFIPRPPASAALTPGSITMLDATRYWGG